MDGCRAAAPHSTYEASHTKSSRYVRAAMAGTNAPAANTPSATTIATTEPATRRNELLRTPPAVASCISTAKSSRSQRGYAMPTRRLNTGSS